MVWNADMPENTKIKYVHTSTPWSQFKKARIYFHAYNKAIENRILKCLC